MSDGSASPAEVGPVLIPGPVGDAVIAAIRALNPEARVVDRGAYVRVLVSGRCVLQRTSVEAYLGRPFQLPGDLEAVMPSLKGIFTVSSEWASWAADEPRPPESRR